MARMSPRHLASETSPALDSALRRAWLAIGLQIRDARIARHWSVRELAARASVSVALAYRAEAGQPTSVEALGRLAHALGLRLEVEMVDPRRRNDTPRRTVDPVHAAMGELEAAHLRRLGFAVGIDEPYQHYQFAGRADVISWDVERYALLHIENRTRFPDFGEMAGSYNAKRAYLGRTLADRLRIPRWRSETHVMVALWSSEGLHALRLRRESFRSLCPDTPAGFSAWWAGTPPAGGATSALIVLDPAAAGRQRRCIGFDDALAARPRHRGYAEAAAALQRPGW